MRYTLSSARTCSASICVRILFFFADFLPSLAIDPATGGSDEVDDVEAIDDEPEDDRDSVIEGLLPTDALGKRKPPRCGSEASGGCEGPAIDDGCKADCWGGMLW